MRVVLLVVLLNACAYRAGSFRAWSQDFAGAHTTVGCLDVAIARRLDPQHGAAIGYVFGNRCDEPALVDLKHLTVVARTVAGDTPLVPYDPDRAIEPEPLDVGSVGAETIAYRIDADAGDPDGAQLREHLICVDAASFAPPRPPAWLCFEPGDAR